MATRSLLVLLIVTVVARHASAFSCYTCDTTISSSNGESVYPGSPTTYAATGCLDASQSVTADAGTYGCMTKFTNNGGSTMRVTRGISPYLASTGDKYCTNDGQTTTCYCSTDKCNSEKYTASRSVECYQCQMSDYFNNGCGEKFDYSLGYVTKVQGCSGCYKTVTIDDDMTVRYERGCSRGIDVETECVDNQFQSERCGCTGSLCNSAETTVIKSTTAFSAVLVSVMLKFFF